MLDQELRDHACVVGFQLGLAVSSYRLLYATEHGRWIEHLRVSYGPITDADDRRYRAATKIHSGVCEKKAKHAFEWCQPVEMCHDPQREEDHPLLPEVET